jgi:hypothetical protein
MAYWQEPQPKPKPVALAMRPWENAIYSLDVQAHCALRHILNADYKDADFISAFAFLERLARYRCQQREQLEKQQRKAEALQWDTDPSHSTRHTTNSKPQYNNHEGEANEVSSNQNQKHHHRSRSTQD